ncbi:hypothetical protein L484_024993 [Morus notabilis]|uniref:Pentatricopeptide repeat-containing protein n=2 Tax=Morus notabilis TaxID=981085 RepID=W9QVG9_9ROSA|nr:hypothetical protein L484_024993 [Morus notabilis]
MILRKIKSGHFAFRLLQNLSFTSERGPHGGVDLYNSSRILSSYFKSGRVEDAEKLFEEIPERNVVSYSIMIHGYSKNGLHCKAMKSFSHMRNLGLVPNSFTIVGLLGGNLVPHLVHGLTVKCGLESDSIVGTALLDRYARCGKVFYSYKLFERLDDPSLVSCNAIITGFVCNELFEEAISLFNRFRKLGLVPDVATTLTLIQASVTFGWKGLSESIHGLLVKLDLISDVSVSNAILDMYSSLTDLRAARKIFDIMKSRDVISWTTMMGLLVRLDCARDALELFSKMRDSGISCDTVVYMNLCSTCVILGDLKKGKQVHAQAVTCGFGSKLAFTNSLISMYAKCGDLRSSSALFHQTTWKSLVSYTAMISAYLQNGCPKEALNLWTKVRLEENFRLDSVMVISGLTASGELVALELCRQLHCYAFQVGLPRYRSVQNSLISTYSKCGDMKLARDVFKEMGDLRNIVSWNAILNGCGINGYGETALALFNEMTNYGEDPDSTTYLCVLNACSHAGLVDDGLMILHQMVEENKVKLSEEHYGCVVDLLARAGCLPDASGVAIKLVESAGPNAWRALLSGCLLHGNVDLAEYAARRVFEKDPDKSGQVVLLSNIYASVGRFHDAEVLRQSLTKSGLTKNPGISFLNGIPCDFG